jgi:hypothetical protein
LYVGYKHTSSIPTDKAEAHYMADQDICFEDAPGTESGRTTVFNISAVFLYYITDHDYSYKI